MKLRNVITLIASIFSIFLVNVKIADAQVVPTTATITADAEAVPSGSKQKLRLRVINILDERPHRACRVRLFTTVTRIGNTEAEPIPRLIATARRPRGTGKRVRFSYFGDAINGTEANQNQANIQTSVRCGRDFLIRSNSVATNVTCTGGVSKNQFITLLQRNVEIFPSSAR